MGRRHHEALLKTSADTSNSNFGTVSANRQLTWADDYGVTRTRLRAKPERC
jgi:hypothetical protein